MVGEAIKGYKVLKYISISKLSTVLLVEKNGDKYIMKYSDYDNRIIHNEASVLKLINDKFTTKIIDQFYEGNKFFIIINYIRGTGLDKYSVRMTEEVLLIAIKLCKIMMNLHKQKIIYLDLKPSNILISDNDIYLLDFGSAVLDASSIENFYSTVKYLPKSYFYDRKINKNIDVYQYSLLIKNIIENGNLKKDKFYYYISEIENIRYKNISMEKIYYDINKYIKEFYLKNFIKFIASITTFFCLILFIYLKIDIYVHTISTDILDKSIVKKEDIYELNELIDDIKIFLNKDEVNLIEKSFIRKVTDNKKIDIRDRIIFLGSKQEIGKNLLTKYMEGGYLRINEEVKRLYEEGFIGKDFVNELIEVININ